MQPTYVFEDAAAVAVGCGATMAMRRREQLNRAASARCDQVSGSVARSDRIVSFSSSVSATRGCRAAAVRTAAGRLSAS